ncbi:MAG: response regulator [Cyanobacteria bacterium J06635_1]
MSPTTLIETTDNLPGTLTEIIDNLHVFNEGELRLRSGTSAWTLHLSGGQLIYPTNDFHRVRRWDRAIRQQRPNWEWQIADEWLSQPDFWELRLLEQGFAQRQLSLIQAKLVLRSAFQECLFELSGEAELDSEWEPLAKPLSSNCRTAVLSAREIKMLYRKAANMHQEWQAANLGDFSPAIAPVLTQAVDFDALPVNRRYLTGEFSLWDISLWMGRSVTWLTQSLQPLVEQGCLQFQELPDLRGPIVAPHVPAKPSSTPGPFPNPGLTPPLGSPDGSSAQSQPLIACIDDSPVLAHTLKKILESAGYKMLGIQEPMSGFALLIEHKPQMILLDLNLPNADGYSICKFLRDIPTFSKTPIIILTGQDTHVDRLKARMAGATEFIAKPPQPQELLATIKKYGL